MKVIKSKIGRTLAKAISKGDRYGRKNPKKSLAIAGTALVGTNVGLSMYGYKKYKKNKKK